MSAEDLQGVERAVLVSEVLRLRKINACALNLLENSPEPGDDSWGCAKAMGAAMAVLEGTVPL